MDQNQRLEALERTVVYQDQLLRDQNVWILKQQQKIESLEDSLRQVALQLKELQGQVGPKPEADQTSPHYIHR